VRSRTRFFEDHVLGFDLVLSELALGDIMEQDQGGRLSVPLDLNRAHLGGSHAAAGKRDFDLGRAGLDGEAEGLARQIGGREAVHLLGAGVDKTHRAGTVEDQDDVGAGFDDVAQCSPVLLDAGGAQFEFRARPAVLDGEVDGARQQRPDARALDHIILSAAAQCPQRNLAVVDPGTNDDGHFGHRGAEAFEGLHAPAVGEVEVEQNGVELTAGKQVQSLREAGSDGEMELNRNFAAEFGIEQLGGTRIVFEDQDFHPAARCS